MLRSKHVTSWKYLTVQLSRLSADDAGDPDLYGMFYGGSSVRFPGWHTLSSCSRLTLLQHSYQLEDLVGSTCC